MKLKNTDKLLRLNIKRTKINGIDLKILKLLNKRAQVVDEIKAIKNAHGISIHDRNREAEILSRLLSENPGPLSKKEIRLIFSRLLLFFRSRQGTP